MVKGGWGGGFGEGRGGIMQWCLMIIGVWLINPASSDYVLAEAGVLASAV